MQSTLSWEPPPNDPTRERSSDAVNRRIDLQTRGALEEAGASPDAIRARLAELDREWDLDRALIATFSALGSITAANMVRNVRRTGKLGGFGLLFWTQMGFLLHHAVRGWCPPVAVLRRMGFRTAREICAERVALEKRLVIEDVITDTGR
jgi:hypothetical protein